ncbi:hypothetical protein RclHR1_15060001 [Rhizophagus clarus]|uniref:Uncharacterized protein n=1 Tax=Rhizophagus clarus TaxID=94130 RepID=A0A2Z6QE86_9GLOM|nr:hypothetical protein RclHR1_15060001 [Rhizophagus clarus]GES79953.1 hypothetical protein GLOIN_2v1782470 [Rhizophagus clarus]
MAVKLLKLLPNLWVMELKEFLKKLKICNNCRQRFAKKRKRSAEINHDQTDVLEVIDIDILSEVITNLLEDASSNNQELHLHCQNK